MPKTRKQETPVAPTATTTETTETPKAPKARKRGTCLLTGVPTSHPTCHFRPGMDARLKGLLLSVFREQADLETALAQTADPVRVADLLRTPTGLTGFRLEGDRLVLFGRFQVAEAKAPKAPKEAAA